MGSWWIVDQPIQKVKGESVTKTLSGAMTTVGNNRARFDSPDLEAPRILSWLPSSTNPVSPPFQLCQPSTP